MSACKYDVKDLALADASRAGIDWALPEIPVVLELVERFTRDKPLRNTRISACLHITTETANLARVLTAGGADLALCASNPLSTQDDVAAALVAHEKITVFARRGEGRDDYYCHLNATLDHRPQITLDDGAELVSEAHKHRRDLLDGVLGGTEETTTGVLRLRAMARDGALRYPIIAVNDAMTKHLFDNRYGARQSTLDGLIQGIGGGKSEVAAIDPVASMQAIDNPRLKQAAEWVQALLRKVIASVWPVIAAIVLPAAYY